MKNTIKLTGGMAAAVLALLVFAGCPNDIDPAHTHQWGEWEVTTAPTCTEEGLETRACTLDPSHTETQAVLVDPDAHGWGEWTGTVTCTEAGTGTRACSLKAEHTETDNNLQPLGHSYEWEETTAPTCTAAGIDTGTCSRDAVTATRAGAAINPNAHDWGEWEGTVTCTEAGAGTRACLLNAEHTEEGDVIPALGHDYQNWTQTTAPACTTAGVDTGTCTHDPAHKTTRAGTAALGHDAGDWHVTLAATCTATGTRQLRCTRDNAVLNTDTVAALGHDYQWATIAPSAIEEGMDKEVCSRCTDETGNTRNITPSTAITTTQQWNDAHTQLNGKTGNYTLNIGGSFNVAGIGSNANSFGPTAAGSSLTVTLKGSGTLSLSSNGTIIRIAANQTLIIDSANLILQGWSNNTIAFVYVNSGGKLELRDGTIRNNTNQNYTVQGYGYRALGGGVYNAGTFIMSGGTISGNTAITSAGISYSAESYGGGVHNTGTFTMNGGTISGNTASAGSTSNNYRAISHGGGVFNTGTFTMNGGTISGNKASITAATSNLFWAYGGGVYNEGTFRIVNGTIYGSNEANTSLRNTVTVSGPGTASGAALYGSAQYGTFSIPGDITSTWNSNGSLGTTNDTIMEVNSVSKIEITQQPAKTVYLIGEQLNITGLVVTATYSGSTVTIPVTAANITGFNSAAAGEQTLTVTYGGKTATFTVTVWPTANMTVTNTNEWNTALSAISNGGNNQSYVITVSGNVAVAGTAYPNRTFGSITGLSVTLKGTGRLYLSSQGSIIDLAANQTLIIDSAGLTLEGLKSGQNGATQDNTTSVVVVYGGTAKLELRNGTITGNTSGGVSVHWGTFTMSGGEISGNTSGSSNGGGGVYVMGDPDNPGTFTMSGGKISGNNASQYGGGVRVNYIATFTMSGGIISGNNAMYGGGVMNSSSGTFRIVTGTVYGSNETNTSLRNTASYNAALQNDGTAQRGTFSGTTWNSMGDLNTTNNTVNVVNGVLQ